LRKRMGVRTFKRVPHNPADHGTIPSAEQLAGQELKRLRTDRGWSQEAVARRMSASGYDWHQTTVGRTESATRPLRVNEAVVLAAIFEVPITQLLIPVAMKLSDVDKEIEDTEEAHARTIKMLAELQSKVDQITVIHLKIAEAYRKVTNATEKLEDRLKLLREIQRVIKVGHQMPPDLAAQLAAVSELISVPGLAEALEAGQAQQ
jgi:transcriptional regulator with XRE-family HTH domain